MLPVAVEQPAQEQASSPPELHPLWGVVCVLAEIAERVERRRIEEMAVQHEPDDEKDKQP